MLKPNSVRGYTTDLPCGAAMDCISEYAFELLEKEVLEEMLPGERKADAWNRISKSKNFKQIGEAVPPLLALAIATQIALTIKKQENNEQNI